MFLALTRLRQTRQFGSSRGISCPLCGLRRLPFFERKFQLLELSGKLFALASEDYPPVFLDRELQMLDLLRVGPQLLVLFNKLLVWRSAAPSASRDQGHRDQAVEREQCEESAINLI